MRTRKKIPKLALMIVAVAALALNGCSMIGLTIGASADASKPNQKAVPGSQVMTIAPGTRITIILKDGSWLSGKYFGLKPIPSEQYAAIYSQEREQKLEGILLPALGESIHIGESVLGLYMNYEKKLEGTFEGLGHDRIFIKRKGRAEVFGARLSTVAKIASDRDDVISGETIQRLIIKGKIPVLTMVVVIEGKAGKTLVTMDNVSQIEIPVQKSGALTGFFVGAVFDAAFVIALIYLSDLNNFAFM